MNDKGGNVVKTIRHRNRLVASGRPVEIRGYCRSACTIYITMPNACLSPRATVGFHAPRLPGTTIIPPVVDELMAQSYRPGIRRKCSSEWNSPPKPHRISAREYARLDPQTRLCRKYKRGGLRGCPDRYPPCPLAVIPAGAILSERSSG